MKVLTLVALFSSLSAGDEQPLDVVFVIDVGHQMAEWHPQLVAGARLASYELSLDDRTAVVAASSSPKVVIGLNSKRDELSRAFQKSAVSIWAQKDKPRLFDAVALAIKIFPAADRTRKRFVIALTNTADTQSVSAPTHIIEQARKSTIAITFVVIAPSGSTYGDPQLNIPRRIRHFNEDAVARSFRLIADRSGGEVFVLNLDGYVLGKVIAHLKGAD